MLRFKGVLCVGVFICFLGFSGVLMAEENPAVMGDMFQQQINELNDQLKVQNRDSDKLKKSLLISRSRFNH